MEQLVLGKVMNQLYRLGIDLTNSKVMEVSSAECGREEGAAVVNSIIAEGTICQKRVALGHELKTW